MPLQPELEERIREDRTIATTDHIGAIAERSKRMLNA
jgi:hypothetical protein